MATKKSNPTWSEVKNRLAEFDRAGLLALVHDLYAASRSNKVFLHARLGVGDSPLQPYKDIISRWICPDVLRNEDISVAKAKKAISDYKKAVGRPEGIAELQVFYCEEAFALLGYCGIGDESFFTALVLMFEHALKTVMALPEKQREAFLERLENVRLAGRTVGWGVSDDFDGLWKAAGLEPDR